MKLLLLLAFVIVIVSAYDPEKLYWKEDDGLEIKIVRPIKDEKCKIKSQAGDIVHQYYALKDKDGKEIGSNFGKTPYVFTLGKNQVIPGMDRAMTDMCIGEKRKITIPPALGFDKAGREKINFSDEDNLYYVIQLVDIVRAEAGETWTDDDGLKIEVLRKAPEAKCVKSAKGDKIHQHYTLHLEDGTLLESTYQMKMPYVFTLGKNQVIVGIDRAMTGMCEGERRKVTIPSKLAYGDKGVDPDIPPKATLIFDIELYKLERAAVNDGPKTPQKSEL